ncbi:MAG: alpha/beta hydrolase [Bacteroidota bacterium]
MAETSLNLLNLNRIFAIPLSNSDHRKWADGANNSELIYDWQDIPAVGNESKETLYKVVAQQYPSYMAENVKNIADGIYIYFHLREGDGILGFSEGNILSKIGIIKSKIKSDLRQIKTNVEWIENFQPTIIKAKIFNRDCEIQKISPETLNQLDFAQLIINKIDRNPFDFIKEVSNSKPDIMYQEIDRKNYEQKKDPGGDLEIFYGTNRTKTGSNVINEFYGDNLGELITGICKITIPPGHKQGEIERPRKILLWQLNENKNEHVTLTSLKEFSRSKFDDWLKGNIAISKNKSALIFIHGFNTTFAEAAWRTGQITYDIPFNKEIAGFFSWPSSGKTMDYGRDIERADASIPDFIKFIDTLLDQTGLEHLHFIAHSMGNRILTRALNKIVKTESFKDKIKTISQIILAAPDIDKDVFDKDILPEFQLIGKRRTLYASDKDKAMKFSRTLRDGLSRIGAGGNDIFVSAGLDTVDASNVDSDGNHHSYMFETNELLTDLNMLLTENLDPIKRSLKEAKKDEFKYWLFVNKIKSSSFLY